MINLSAAWQPPSDGSAAWLRRFGRPSGIGPGDRVWLVFDGGEGSSLHLNGFSLDGHAGRHDVTALLLERNELALVPSDQGAGGMAEAVPLAPAHGRRPLDSHFGSLRLEIESRRP